LAAPLNGGGLLPPGGGLHPHRGLKKKNLYGFTHPLIVVKNVFKCLSPLPFPLLLPI